jgi:hypothetical protein
MCPKTQLWMVGCVHQKYACHILSLTVKIDLKTTAVNNLIYKIKDGLHHIYSNNTRK